MIATVTSSPYTYNWTSVAAGSYTLTAIATDNQTGATTSTPVNIAPALYYMHPDQIDTARVITNQAQQVVWRWDNDDPFGGNVANENPSSLGAFTFNPRFPGQYFDKETNNHYNYHRDYSPEIGRYIESDPIGLKGGINTYSYVRGNPLTSVDPLGLLKWSGSFDLKGGGVGKVGRYTRRVQSGFRVRHRRQSGNCKRSWLRGESRPRGTHDSEEELSSLKMAG